MPTKTSKKSASKKSLQKKRIAAPKTAKKKTSAKSKAVKQKPVKPSIKKTAGAKRSANKKTALPVKQVLDIEPGPPFADIPPVEEPSRHEEAVGIVTHYYSHLNVAVVQISKGKLKTGDTIRIQGHSTDFTQQVSSMEYEHSHVDEATAGQNVGLLVINHARVHDIVFLVK